jgi:hypothetical protein
MAEVQMMKLKKENRKEWERLQTNNTKMHLVGLGQAALAQSPALCRFCFVSLTMIPLLLLLLLLLSLLLLLLMMMSLLSLLLPLLMFFCLPLLLLLLLSHTYAGGPEHPASVE